MPKVLEQTEITFDRADLTTRHPISRPVVPAPRSSGIHVSGVLRYIAKVSGLAKVLDELDQESLPLPWACGVMWEEFAASMYPEMLWQPGETCVDDVWMTCDGLSINGNAPSGSMGQLDEFKFTWKKVRPAKEFLDEWLWMQQGRCYCWGYDCYLVRYHILYVNGHPKKYPPIPIYVRYLVEFTQSDLDQTWRMVTANKDKAIAEVNV